MSDTTPRPDETPNDPTAPPPPPADPAPASEAHAAPDAPPPPTPPSATDPAPAADAGAAYPPSAYPPPTSPPPAYSPPAQSYPQPPQQPFPATVAAMDPTQERQWGMLAHIIGAIGMVTTGIGGFIGTLVVYLVYKDRGPFVRAHAANSLNVQITTFIGVVIGVITVFFVIGIFILIAVAVWAFVVHIIGAVKANNGEWYDPPLTIKFVK